MQIRHEEQTIDGIVYQTEIGYELLEDGGEKVLYTLTQMKVPPTPPYEPTQLDRIETQLDDADTIQAELLFNQANSDLDTQLILETLAEILLNQQGV